MSVASADAAELTNVVAHCAAISPEWDYVPNRGNLGDSLITLGTLSAFARAGVALHRHDDTPGRVDRPVLIAGGGNLVPYYHDVQRALGGLKTSAVSRVVVLPHTIAGHDDLLAGLDARFEIFCRDRVSFAHVRSLHPHFVGLGHDMTIHIDPTALFAEYEELVPLADPAILRIMERITTLAADHSRRNQRRGKLFRTDQESTPGRFEGENLDLSGIAFASWFYPQVTRMMGTMFLRAISMFDEIETDRLHVAMGGGLLGIPVRLYPNSYHKNASVHAMTISRLYPTVRMADGG